MVPKLKGCYFQFNAIHIEVCDVEVGTFPFSEERGIESNSSSDKVDEWIVLKTRYGCTIGRKDSSYNPNTGTTIKWSDVVAAEVDDIDNPMANYYEVLGINENEVNRYYKFSITVSLSIKLLELVWVVDSLTLMSYAL